jgi:endonuclease/exonuclease/phosphatase family metal-dependent hydrolase
MADRAPGRLRILTLNCWNVTEPLAERMALVRAGVEALAPDLVAFQEVVVRRDGLDQGAWLLDGLGFERALGAAYRWTETADLLPHDREGDAFGNLVASRWPILRTEVRELPGLETGERRSAVAALVDSPHGQIAFTTTHLNWRLDHGWVRERQVVALAAFVEAFAADATLPPVLTGDLNAEPDATEIRFLRGLASIDGRSTYFQDAWAVAGEGPGFTWDNRNPFARYGFDPDRRIDYILVGGADRLGRGWIEAARLAMTEPRDGIFPSDHFGVVAEIRVRPETSRVGEGTRE